MKYLLFWDVTQHRLVASYRRFGTTSVPSSRVQLLDLPIYTTFFNTELLHFIFKVFVLFSQISLSLSLSPVVPRSTQDQFPDVSIPICFSPASNTDFLEITFKSSIHHSLGFPTERFPLWYSYTLPSQFLLLTFFPHALFIVISLFLFLRYLVLCTAQSTLDFWGSSTAIFFYSAKYFSPYFSGVLIAFAQRQDLRTKHHCRPNYCPTCSPILRDTAVDFNN